MEDKIFAGKMEKILNLLCQKAYKASCDNGWWVKMMIIVSVFLPVWV